MQIIDADRIARSIVSVIRLRIGLQTLPISITILEMYASQSTIDKLGPLESERSGCNHVMECKLSTWNNRLPKQCTKRATKKERASTIGNRQKLHEKPTDNE